MWEYWSESHLWELLLKKPKEFDKIRYSRRGLDPATAISRHICLAAFLITLSLNGTFVSNSFLRRKTIYKVAIIKTKSATIAFFLFSLLFLFLLSFFFVTVILELLGLKRLAFWRLFTPMTAIFFLSWFKKKKKQLNVYFHFCMFLSSVNLKSAEKYGYSAWTGKTTSLYIKKECTREI